MVCLILHLDKYEVDDFKLHQGFPLCSISINVVVLSLKALLENSECNWVGYAFIVRKCSYCQQFYSKQVVNCGRCGFLVHIRQSQRWRASSELMATPPIRPRVALTVPVEEAPVSRHTSRGRRRGRTARARIPPESRSEEQPQEEAPMLNQLRLRYH